MAAAALAHELFHLEVMVHYDGLAYCCVTLCGECVHDRGVVRPSVAGSWSIALVEYCFQVRAHRIGYTALSAYQLKTLQEAITLIVFVGFASVYLGEGFLPKHLVGFLLLAVAVWTVFQTSYGMKW